METKDHVVLMIVSSPRSSDAVHEQLSHILNDADCPVKIQMLQVLPVVGAPVDHGDADD
jgi:acetolactate synthase regulatory subunit